MPVARKHSVGRPRGRLALLLGLLVALSAAAVWMWLQRDLTPNQLRQLPLPELQARANRDGGREAELCVLGERLLDLADVEAAAAAYRRARDLDAFSARALAGWILAVAGRRHPGWAERALRELAAARPERFEPKLALARLYMMNGDLDQPGELLREAVAQAEGDSEPVYHYGVWSGMIGATGRGVENLLEAVRRAPRVASYRVAAADLLIHLARYPEAETHLKEALRLTPEYAPGHYQYGRLLLAGRRSDAEMAEGVRHLERALELAPGWDLPLLTLGRHRTQQGQPEEGVELLERAGAAGASGRQFLAALAQGYYQLERKEEGDRLIARYNAELAAERADQQAQQALRRDPANVDVRLRRARKLRAEGKELKALLVYREVLAVRPGHAEASRAADELTQGP